MAPKRQFGFAGQSGLKSSALKPVQNVPTPVQVKYDEFDVNVFTTNINPPAKPHDIKLKDSTVQNYHILNNIYSVPYQNFDIRQYSLLQLRFFDYVTSKQQQDKNDPNRIITFEPLLKNPLKYNEQPIPNMGIPKEGAAQDQQGAGQQNQMQAIPVDLVYDNVFQNIPLTKEPIHSAQKFFEPEKISSEKFDGTSSQQPSLAPTKEKEISPKYTKRIKAPKKLSSTTEVSKNYEYLFESTITKAGQYNVSDRPTITISSSQLKCGEPQNQKAKINILTSAKKTRLYRKSYGSIEFSKLIDNINLIDISSFVEIEQRYVDINFQLAEEFGVDLNQDAMVTLENVFPVYLDNLPKKPYEESLKGYCTDKDLIFIHYFANEGILIFYARNFDKAPYQFPLE